jgi:hypothetical protein
MTVPRGESEIFALLEVDCGVFSADSRNYPPPIAGRPQPIAAADNS